MSQVPSHDLLNRLERYRPLLDPAEIELLLAAADQLPLPALRVNTLKIAEAEARTAWPGRYGWRITPVPFCPAGWQVEARELGQRPHPLGQTIEYDNGQYYIQDAASMLPVELFSTDQDQPLILDLAAAPGGKTTHLAAHFGDRGVILANDSSASRLAALRANLQSWGVFGVLVTHFPGERIGQWLPEQFDRVLLDAPCSGDTLRVSTGRKKRTVSDSERANLCQRQESLLVSALQAARVGGEIVYSTCTLAPEEDEGVIDALLRAYPGAVEVVSADHVPLASTAPALTADGARKFQPGLNRAIRLWPHRFRTSGFFAARLRKLAPVFTPPGSLPNRPWAFNPLSQREQDDLAAGWRDVYGFDLGTTLDDHSLTLWRRDKSIFALPEMLRARLGHVPHMAAGLLIGQDVGGQIIPTHEVITRFEARFAGGRLTLPAEVIPAWIDGRDLREPGLLGTPPGSVFIAQDEDGRFLGLGSVQRDRVRNLRPRRLTYQG